MQKNHIFKHFLLLAFGTLLTLGFSEAVYATCGTTLTWQADANTTAWNTATNWNPNNVPNANTETAFIRADWQIPQFPTSTINLSCLEINSGSLTASTGAGILTIDDDYFKNLNTGSLIIPGGSTFQVSMIGTATQSFSNVDPIPRLLISNATTVNLTHPFVITNSFTISAGTGNVNINANLEVQQTTALVIPASATVTVASGVELKLNGGVTVNGVLKLMPGARLVLANGRTLSVPSGGTLQLAGSSGNSAVVDSYSSSETYTVSISGKINASYFSISHMTAAGVNMASGSQIIDLSHGSFNYIANGAYGLTITGTATAPSALNYVGFYGQSATTPKNVNATGYTGGTINFGSWSGAGDTANELDPNTKIFWGSPAATELLVYENSASGVPPATIARNTTYTQFATFAFALSGTTTATDITSIKFTVGGTNSNSDIAGVRVYKETDNNCTYNAGSDSLVGTYVPTGSPGNFTATFSSGDIAPSSTTPRCVHVFVSTSTTAQVDNTIRMQILSTDDIVNSQNYALSSVDSPPVSASASTITGGTLRKWNGGNGTAMATTTNWTPNGAVSNTIDCQIGNGYAIPVMAATFSCLNAEFLSGGTLNWNSTANIFTFNGALIVGSAFTFQNTTTTAILRATGTTDQSVTLNGSSFAGNFQNSNSTGVVTVENSGSVGSLTLNNGTLRIPNGVTLTVNGAVSIASGATLDIEPGGTLSMANGTTVTVNAGGFLEMIGSSGLPASMKATSNAASYSVVVTGTIKAQYYSFKNLALNGVTINSAATIDATYHLQDGSYTYPGVNNAIMLRLLRQVPSNSMANMTFDAGGSTVTGAKSVSTNTTAGTLTISNYSGDMTGTSFSTSVNYIVSWTLPTTTLDITLESSIPSSANQGDVVNAGRFGLQQTSAGSFSDTNITFVRLTLTGTGASSDVTNASLYYDSSCSGTGGTLIGTQTFSGSPARADFSGITGAPVQASVTSPPKRCFYATLAISSSATNGATVGVQVQSNSHITNSAGYAFNAAAAPPISMGTTSIVGSTTYWTGASSTAWALAGNWNGGIPTSSLNCVINSATNNPVISTGTQVCKSLTIGSGTLTMTGGALEIYGSFDNSGTFTQSTFPLTIRDNGTTATSQTITNSGTFNNIAFNKTAGGSVSIGGSSITVSTLLSMPAGSNFTFYIDDSKTLTASLGLTISAGTMDVKSGGTLQLGASQTLTVSGGTFQTEGTNDSYPQSLTNKGTITRSGGSGTWNFTATSGTVNLVGFVFDWLGTSGLNISGTTNVTQINGGQLRDLPNSSGMRGIQLTTSGSLPTTISNFGWYWGSSNTVPGQATTYYLAYSGGCTSRTVTFDQWFGDFWPYTGSVTPDNHISETACNLVIDRAASPVTLTEFKATPYDGKVVLEWVTGLEWYHKGFNIYRSLSPSTGFVQVNNEVIRNDLFSTLMHGTYAFIDEDVTNDVTYYYMLEDISTFEDRSLHGPLSALPKAVYGPPPPSLASTIATNNPNGSGSSGGSGSSSSSPGLVELEPNVQLVAKTANSYRLKITIPAHSLTADVSHPSYQHVSIPLYAPTITAGSPELLARTMMLKVPAAASAQMNIVSETHSTVNSLLLAPAPAWVLNGSHYENQWQLDSSAYSQSALSPTLPISLGTMAFNQGQHYLPIVISPVAYNPTAQQMRKYSEVVVDIFLSSNTTWAPQTPVNLSDVWGAEGALLIGIAADGVHEITYDQMVTAGVIAPFDHGDTTKFKLYFLNQEQPLEVVSSGLFSSGDKIRFFAPHIETPESALNYVLLVPDYASPIPGLRMDQVDVSAIGGTPTTANGFTNAVHAEENNVAVFNEPYDQDMDLFVWGLYYGISGGAKVSLSTDVELPYLLNNNTVTVQALVKSRATTSTNYNSNLQLYVNDVAVPGGNQSFSGSDVQIVSFTVDGTYFAPGKNKLTLEPTGNNLVSGEYDMVYIDAIDVYYTQAWIADGDKILVSNSKTSVDIQVDNFSSNQIVIYDLSQSAGAKKWINAPTALNSGTYSVLFTTPADATLGRRLWISTDDKYVQAASFQLNSGSSLLSTGNAADVVYIGAAALLDAAEPLAEIRKQQGYKTKLVSLDNIYSEFGQGMNKPESIRDFLVYAHNSWSTPPKYVVLLGDGTYDPKAYQNAALPNHFPVKLIKGAAFNFGSDHWYVTEDGAQTPFAVVGRIPARTPNELTAYVTKVINYEHNLTKPSSAAMSLLSDKAHYTGENFDAFASDLSSSISGWSSSLSVSKASRTQLGDTNFKARVLASFDSSSIIHFMGHGAENMWADSNIFTTNDVDNLTNSKLPIVAAMDCLNANFYDPDLESLAEKLVMKSTGGAIAFWGSTSMTPPSVQSVYQKAFYENLLTNSSMVGDAVKLSKLQAFEQAPYAEAELSWTIIGDPMVSAVLPSSSASAPASGGGGSSGCSLFAAYGTQHNTGTPWDLVFGFMLEVLTALALIRFCARLCK